MTDSEEHNAAPGLEKGKNASHNTTIYNYAITELLDLAHSPLVAMPKDMVLIDPSSLRPPRDTRTKQPLQRNWQRNNGPQPAGAVPKNGRPRRRGHENDTDDMSDLDMWVPANEEADSHLSKNWGTNDDGVAEFELWKQQQKLGESGKAGLTGSLDSEQESSSNLGMELAAGNSSSHSLASDTSSSTALRPRLDFWDSQVSFGTAKSDNASSRFSSLFRPQPSPSQPPQLQSPTSQPHGWPQPSPTHHTPGPHGQFGQPSMPPGFSKSAGPVSEDSPVRNNAAHPSQVPPGFGAIPPGFAAVHGQSPTHQHGHPVPGHPNSHQHGIPQSHQQPGAPHPSYPGPGPERNGPERSQPSSQGGSNDDAFFTSLLSKATSNKTANQPTVGPGSAQNLLAQLQQPKQPESPGPAPGLSSGPTSGPPPQMGFPYGPPRGTFPGSTGPPPELRFNHPGSMPYSPQRGAEGQNRHIGPPPGMFANMPAGIMPGQGPQGHHAHLFGQAPPSGIAHQGPPPGIPRQQQQPQQQQQQQQPTLPPGLSKPNGRD